MKQFQLDFWNGFKKLFCYCTGLRMVSEHFVQPWKQYERLIDIPIDEMKRMIKEERIKTLIIDMDGTLKYYRLGLLPENKRWVEAIKDEVNVVVISNANKELTAKVADQLGVKYIYSAKKPSAYGFEKIGNLTHAKKEECLVIGDAVRADILGAQRCGIQKTILLKDLNLLGLAKGKDQFEDFYYTAFCFILYAFMGWLIEMGYHLGKGILLDRGFLIGPICVMYGFGALLMLQLNKKIVIKGKGKKVVALWLSIFMACSMFEYFTSYIIEAIFDIRLWDYTGLSYNINGRVRLITSIAWSNCGLVLIYFLQPIVAKLYDKILRDNKRKLFIGLHMLLWMIYTDAIISSVWRLLHK